VDEDTAVSYDANWLANPQIEVEPVPDDATPEDADSWPFTIAPADVDSIDDEAIRQRL